MHARVAVNPAELFEHPTDLPDQFLMADFAFAHGLLQQSVIPRLADAQHAAAFDDRELRHKNPLDKEQFHTGSFAKYAVAFLKCHARS